jgi:hypothetical protein
MIDHVNFLREKAAALRDLAQRSPSIAGELRYLADELESKAAELVRSQEGPTDTGEP